MIKFIVDLLTFYIPNRKLRKKAKVKLETLLFGYKVITRAKRVGKGLKVTGYSSVNINTIIGENVRINGLKISGYGNVKIGNYCIFAPESFIITQNHNYEGDTIPYDKTYIYKDVIIEDFAWIGARAMLLPGTRIGEGAIIQGGAVVHGEIPPYAIAGGNPAKVFKYRDIEHFKKLKEQGKFLGIQ